MKKYVSENMHLINVLTNNKISTSYMQEQQDRQCMYNTMVSWVCATNVAVEKQSVLYIMSVCGLRYPACNVHVPYCNLWSAQLHNIFPHYLINGTVKKKNVIEHKMCLLIFSATSVCNISHSWKK